MQLYFKFQSFNVFGGGLEDLSSCAIYSYTPNGAGALGPVTSALAAGIALDFGMVSDPVAESDDWGTVSGPVSAVIDLGNLT